MNRTEWKAHHSSLRYTLRYHPKSTMAARTLTINGTEFWIRVGRQQTYPTRYHQLNDGLRICRPTITDRPIQQRIAEEMQVAQIDRDAARKSRHRTDKIAYQRAIEYARWLRTEA